MIVYATDANLAEYVDELPDNPARYLRAASKLVAHAIRFDRYDVDPAGKPTDPWIIDALADATAEQAAYWVSNDIDPAAGVSGLAEVVTSSSAGGASYTLDAADTGARAAEARDSLRSLVTGARLTLEAASLGSCRVASW